MDVLISIKLDGDPFEEVREFLLGRLDRVCGSGCGFEIEVGVRVDFCCIVFFVLE